MRKGRISPKKSTLKDLEGFIDPADTSLNTPVISDYATLPASYQRRNLKPSYQGYSFNANERTAPASTTAVNVFPINTEALLADNAQLQQRQANQAHFQSLLKAGIAKNQEPYNAGTVDYPPTSLLSQNSPGAPNAQFMGDRQSQDFHNELIASELIGGAVGAGLSRGARAINQAEKSRKLSKALSTNLDEAPLNPDLIEGVLPKIQQSKGEFLASSDNLILDSKKIKTAQNDIAFTQKAEELQSKVPLTRVVDKSNLVVKDGKLFNSVEPYTVMTGEGLTNTTSARNTSHWSYGHVGDPGHGSWKGKSTAIVSDYETLSKKGYALDLDPTDTFFYNSKNMELPEGSLILTRDKKLYDDIIKNTNQKNVKYYPNTTNDEFERIVNSYSKREGDEKGIKIFEEYLEKNWKEGKDVAHYKPSSEYKSVGFQGHGKNPAQPELGDFASIYEGHPDWNPDLKTVGSPFGGGSSKVHSNTPLFTIERSGNYRLSENMFDLHPNSSEFKALLTYPKEMQLSELEKYKSLKRRKPGSKSIAELENAMAKNSGFDSYSDFQKSIELKLPNYKKYGGLISNYKDGGETDPPIQDVTYQDLKEYRKAVQATADSTQNYNAAVSDYELIMKNAAATDAIDRGPTFYDPDNNAFKSGEYDRAALLAERNGVPGTFMTSGNLNYTGTQNPIGNLSLKNISGNNEGEFGFYKKPTTNPVFVDTIMQKFPPMPANKIEPRRANDLAGYFRGAKLATVDTKLQPIQSNFKPKSVGYTSNTAAGYPMIQRGGGTGRVSKGAYWVPGKGYKYTND